jgi:hypothetical protein
VGLRYHILTKRGEVEQALLAEDCQLLAFAGSSQNAQWLDSAVADKLLLAQPDANVHAEKAHDFLQKVLDGFEVLRPHLNEVAVQRGEELLEQLRRVRTAARWQGVSQRAEPQLPPDVLVRWTSDLKVDRVALPTFSKTHEHYREIQAKVEAQAKKAGGRAADVASKAASKTAEAAVQAAYRLR